MTFGRLPTSIRWLRTVGLLVCTLVPLLSDAQADEEKPPALVRLIKCLHPAYDVEDVRAGNSTGGYTIDVDGRPKWVLIAEERTITIVSTRDRATIAEVTVGRPPTDSSDYPTYSPASSDATEIFTEQMGLRQRHLISLARQQGYSVRRGELHGSPVISINAPSISVEGNGDVGMTLVSLINKMLFVEFAWKHLPAYGSTGVFMKARDKALPLMLGCLTSTVGESRSGQVQRKKRGASLREQKRPDPEPAETEDSWAKERRLTDEANEKESRRADAAYEKAEAALLSAFKADDASSPGRVLRVLSETQGSEGSLLLGRAPCIAMEQSTAEGVRLTYEQARRIRMERGDRDKDYGCVPVTMAIDRGRPDLLQALVTGGAPLSDDDMGHLIQGVNASLPADDRVALFNTLARAPNAPTYDWTYHLVWAIADADITAALLRHVGGLQGIGDRGGRALRYAVDSATGAEPAKRRALLSQIQKLIDLGVDVNHRESDYKPALILGTCDLELMDILLHGHADPNILDFSGYETPLNHALGCKTEDEKLAAVSKLIAAGADVNLPRDKQEYSHRPVLAEVCEAGGHPELKRLLQSSGAKVDVPDMHGRTSLMTMFQKTPASVDGLVACGAAVNTQDIKGMTALQHFIEDGAIDAARTLCAHGAEPKNLCSLSAADGTAPSAQGDCFQVVYGPGQPAPNRHYKATLADGHVIEGRTDAQGRTRVCGADSDTAKISVYSN